MTLGEARLQVELAQDIERLARIEYLTARPADAFLARRAYKDAAARLADAELMLKVTEAA